jgi:hypothetical protein
MKLVTRDIDPENAQDLLKRVPRACMAFAGEDGPQAIPIEFVWQADCYLAGIPEIDGCLPNPGDEVVFLIDEGVSFFDLRAIYIRGQVKPASAPAGVPAGCSWFEVVPYKTVAWDYGMLREVGNEG